MLIPAGVLLGLGIGLLAGYPGARRADRTGAWIYRVYSPCIAAISSGRTEGRAGPSPRPRGGLVLIGAFLVLVGIGLVWAPPRFWPVIAALFLILLGLLFLFRAFIHR